MNISVIVPAHGRADLLIQCLLSLSKERQGELDYSVCVVDDSSGLDEGSIREKVGSACPLLWRSFPTGRGRSAARNEGIQSTKGDIVVFLDSDMEAYRGFLAAHLKCHEDNPHIAAIGKIIWPKGGSFLKYIGSRGVSKLVPGNTVPPWYFVTGNASVRREDIPPGKAFDESLPGWGGEDQDLGFRLSSAGVRFIYEPEAISYHNFNGTLSRHVRRMVHYGENTLPFLVERHPELFRAVRLEVLKSFTGHLAVSSVVFFPLYVLARMLDFLPLPMKLYDYLTFAAYARGWLKGKHS